MKAVVKGGVDFSEREKFAKKIIRAFDEATKIMRGQLPRPKTNWKKQFAEWDKWAEEAKNERKR